MAARSASTCLRSPGWSGKIQESRNIN